ncbi:substrate-binding periplasmic protein [Pseudomonas sp. Marseille-QA0892]
MLCLISTTAMAGPLVFGFSAGKPPYVFDHEPRGLEYEIIEASFNRAGIAFEARYLPIDRLHLSLERGDLGAVASTNVQGGLSNVAYSDVYLQQQNVAIALASRGYAIDSIEDLAVHSISTFQNAHRLLGPVFGKMAERNALYREEAQQIIRNRMLYSGRIDIVIADLRIHHHLNTAAQRDVDTTQSITIYPIFPPTPYRVAFRDPGLRDRFNDALAKIRANGEYDAIVRRYAGED